MNREVHVRICGGLKVKLLWSTRHSWTTSAGSGGHLPPDYPDNFTGLRNIHGLVNLLNSLNLLIFFVRHNRSHNPEVGGSNPPPATNKIKGLRTSRRSPFSVFAC